MKCPDHAGLPTPPAGRQGWPWTLGEGVGVSECGGIGTGGSDGVSECRSAGEAHDSDTPTPPHPDTSSLPRISIVTPSYNQGQFLEETIRSVLLQGYPDLEYIIIDGGSTDNSVEIIKKYEQWLTYWVSEKDRGMSHAINKGLSRATGEVFGWLNSDDYFLPGALNALMDLRSREPDAVAWVGACMEVEADGAPIVRRAARLGDQEQIARWWRGAFFHQPSCLFDAATFRAAREVDERLFYAMDVELWIRMAAKGRFVGTNVDVSCARMHAATKTSDGLKPLRCVECVVMAQRHGLTDAAVANLRQWVYERQLIHVSRMGGDRLLGDLGLEGTRNLLLALPASRLLRHVLHRAVSSSRRCE